MIKPWTLARPRRWVTLLAVVSGLLLSPAVVAAYEEEVAAWPGPAAAAPPQSFAVFLPLVSQARTPDSFTLIAQARERGEIDEEMALTYEVFATFGDARLPQRFSGDDRGVLDSEAVAEATQRFAELSPATREILVPYLIPPVYAGSWYDLRRRSAAPAHLSTAPSGNIIDRCGELAQGLLVPLGSEHFVVWYPPFDTRFAERATQIGADLERRIYPILTELFREPLGDAGLGCNPGDGRLDIYMVHDPTSKSEGVVATVSTYPGKGCGAAPTYTQVLEEHPAEANVIAHELMHMIQHAYNPAAGCLDSWWTEATANWAIDYFENMDPQVDDQTEQSYAPHYLESAWRWLDDTLDLREYGAYLWPFYLSRYTGSYHPELIAQIFSATENLANGDLYQVINDRIDGGWNARFPEFALFNLNAPPFDHYRQWDAFALRWEDWPRKSISSNVAEIWDEPYVSDEVVETGSMDLGYRVRDLGIAYERIVASADVRLLAFDNTFVGLPQVRVQALIKRPGQGWQGPEDWTNSKWTVYCQDDPAEKVEEILLIITNSNWQRRTDLVRATGPVRIVASDLGCAGYRGSSSWQLVGQSSNGQSQTDYTLRGEASPTFTLMRRTLAGNTLRFEYQPTAGNASWLTTFAGVDFQTGNRVSCTRTGGGALNASLGGMLVTEDLSGEEMNRRFFGSGLTPAPDRCPDFTTWSHIPWLSTDIENSGLLPWPITATQGRLRGSDSFSQNSESSSSTTISTWDLAALGSP